MELHAARDQFRLFLGGHRRQLRGVDLFLLDHGVLQNAFCLRAQALPLVQVHDPADIGAVEFLIDGMAQEFIPFQTHEPVGGPGAGVNHAFFQSREDRRRRQRVGRGVQGFQERPVNGVVAHFHAGEIGQSGAVEFRRVFHIDAEAVAARSPAQIFHVEMLLLQRVDKFGAAIGAHLFRQRGRGGNGFVFRDGAGVERRRRANQINPALGGGRRLLEHFDGIERQHFDLDNAFAAGVDFGGQRLAVFGVNQKVRERIDEGQLGGRRRCRCGRAERNPAGNGGNGA